MSQSDRTTFDDARAPQTGTGTTRAIVLFCHGSRNPAWREPFDAITRALRDQLPGLPVELAFLELMAPALPDAIDALARRGVQSIRVVPLFLAPGNHTRQDLPALLQSARQRWPGVTMAATEPLGESSLMREAIVRWAMSVAA